VFFHTRYLDRIFWADRPPLARAFHLMPHPKLSATLAESLQAQLELMGSRAPSCRRVLESLVTILSGPGGTALESQFGRAWSKRSFSAYYERPLLVLAALRYDALDEGEAHPLHAALGADVPDPDMVTTARVAQALAADRLGVWMTLRTRRVQTNETKRSVVWRWPAALVGCEGGRRALTLIDVGASAGLNLTADDLDVDWSATDGGPIPLGRHLDVRVRQGFDLRPLDVRKSADRRWLEACVWPGEHERLAQLRLAIEAFAQARPQAELTITTASAVPERLPSLAARAGDGGVVIVYQSMLTGYLAPNERAAYHAGLDRWLTSSPPAGALWMSLEIGDSTDGELGTRIEARFATGGVVRSLELAQTGYHPTTLAIDRAAERELAAAFAPT
jgi:hypothetical protein